ncbi:MAG: nucleotide exchange factor GrpE [Candidatus Saccharibacteria bacterium]|nr:nucleotide exchange factor GrpE [Candidatus Saccharibacteria bacterium]
MTKKDEKPTEKVPNQIAQLQQQNEELTADLQRVRADFENYRKRTEAEVAAARQAGGDGMVLKLLPVIDTLERAIGHLPAELADNAWAQGVAGVAKNLDKIMKGLEIARIDAAAGKEFDPELHYAVQVDDAAEGDTEVIAEELQAGYTRDGAVLRHAMVKVTRQ